MAVTSHVEGKFRVGVAHFRALSTDIKPGHHKYMRGGERGMTSTLFMTDTGALWNREGNEWRLVHDPAADAVEIDNLKLRATDAEQNHTSLLARIEALERRPNGE